MLVKVADLLEVVPNQRLEVQLDRDRAHEGAKPAVPLFDMKVTLLLLPHHEGDDADHVKQLYNEAKRRLAEHFHTQ